MLSLLRDWKAFFIVPGIIQRVGDWDENFFLHLKVNKPGRQMQILGRSDRVNLPGLGLKNIHAKIDTGAFTSSLHCSRAGVVNGRLEFVLLDDEHPEFTGMTFYFDEFTERFIKNSFGVAEKRFIINTTVQLFDEVIQAEFSLSDRDALRFPILLGRKILRDRFLIDVTKKNLSYRSNRVRSSKKKSA
jgi:hypothetical protein